MAVNAILRSDAESLIPEQVSKEIIQGAVEHSAVLSQFRKLPNMTSKTLSMPVLDMLPVAYFVNGDNGNKQTTKMQWDKKRLYAEEIAVIVPIPEAVLDDAEYDIWGEVKPRLYEAFGKKIDGAVLFGERNLAKLRGRKMARRCGDHGDQGRRGRDRNSGHLQGHHGRGRADCQGGRLRLFPQRGDFRDSNASKTARIEGQRRSPLIQVGYAGRNALRAGRQPHVLPKKWRI